MTPEQRAVHERLLATLPKRTHVLLPKTQAKQPAGRTTAKECQSRKVRIRYLKRKAGWDVKKIAAHLNLSKQTVYSYLK
jgi:DNA-binding NarL/FixJ family response regulator